MPADDNCARPAPPVKSNRGRGGVQLRATHSTMKKKDPLIYTGDIFGGAAVATPERNVAYWLSAALAAEGFTETGFAIESASAWEMRAAARTLNTPAENLTAFKTENGWKHYARPGVQLGTGYTEHSILPKYE